MDECRFRRFIDPSMTCSNLTKIDPILLSPGSRLALQACSFSNSKHLQIERRIGRLLEILYRRVCVKYGGTQANGLDGVLTVDHDTWT
jgi:hypothetical protein